MKIKAQKEGRIGVFLPNKDSVIKFITEGAFSEYHSILPNSGMMLGCDVSVNEVIKKVELSDRLAVLTGSSAKNNLGHSLSIITNNELELMDIGYIEDSDIEIIK